MAINCLLSHESASPPVCGIDRVFRAKLATKLDREIQRWCNNLPKRKADATQSVSSSGQNSAERVEEGEVGKK